MSNIAESPYSEKEIPFDAFLRSDQLDNNNYLSIRKNILQVHEGKCLQEHGYIVKIGNITNPDDTKLSNVIPREHYDPVIPLSIRANCRMCLPIKQTLITAQVVSTNKMMIRAKNGPIDAILTMDRINTKEFKNTGDIIRYKYINNEGQTKLKAITEDDYVKILIETVKYSDGKPNIIILASLKGMSTDKEIAQFQKDELYLPNKMK